MMSRRDTIIISVLINSGLLAILFATAWNDDEATLTSPQPQPQTMVAAARTPQAGVQPAAPNQENKGGDEVDAVLRRYAQSQTRTQPAPAKPVEQPVAAAAPKRDDGMVEVVVKPGDSLSQLATANGTTMEAIVKANHLTSRELQVGQRLTLPKPERKEVAAVEPVKQAGPEYYTVQPGDNPWTIARKHKVALKDLLKLNDLDDQKARRLKAGDKLRVR